MSNPTKRKRGLGGVLTPAQLTEFLLTHLNRIYCAKSHLHERLPELAELVFFSDLRHAVMETWEDIGRQIARIEQVYVLMDGTPSLSNCSELIEFIETGFTAIYIQKEETKLRDMAILFYLSIIESLESASFQLLQMVTDSLPDKQVRQLLKENFEKSKADRVLFLEIAAKYIS